MNEQILPLPQPDSGLDYASELARQPGTVPTVDYSDTGRVTGSGGMPEEDFLNTLRFTQRKVLRGAGKSETHYVEFVGEARAPVLRVRPQLTAVFDKTKIAVREPASMPGIPAALVVGWTVPGSYTVTVEAFPFLPATFALIVGAAS
jgi:hypothetical protein